MPAMSGRVEIKPSSYAVSGLKLEDLLSKRFVDALKKVFPTAIPGHLVLGFEDSKELLYLSHGRKEGKTDVSSLTVDTSDINMLDTLISLIKEVAE